jgi:hypothetical protein
LGRPLGKPNDAEFQHDVLRRAFALLDEPSGPVLVDHPMVIEAEDEPIACSLPPRYDPNVAAAVDEARGLRKAYDRALARRGVTSVGRVTDADGVPAALEALLSITNGTHWKEAALPGRNTIATCHDIRTYYEEAALELATNKAPGARSVEAWFFEQTEAGKVVIAARQTVKDQGAPGPVWFYMAPGHR